MQGTIGNLGMYAFGVPSGMLVDKKGPRWGVALGIILFAAGYYPIAQGTSQLVPPLMLEADIGIQHMRLVQGRTAWDGSASSLSSQAPGAVQRSRRRSKQVRSSRNRAKLLLTRSAALNFPESRGTATAFPLAAFGLSAMFFAVIALLLPPGTYNFLILLATGTVVLPLISFPFLRVLPPHTYHHLPQNERQVLHRTRDSGSHIPQSEEPGAPTYPSKTPSLSSTESRDPEAALEAGDENSSLLSRSSVEDVEDLQSSKHLESDRNHESPHLDIRGFALLPLPEFWQLFSMLGLLTGIGLMTIK
jgi:hypothetical protein